MDCIINPKTGRAVKKSSALGKRLLKNADKTLKEDCLINPKTGRAVKKSSAIGKQILKGMKPIVQSPQNFDDILEGTPVPPKKKKYSFGSFKTPPKYSKTSSPKPTTPPPPKPPKLLKPKKPRVVKPKIIPLPSNLKIPKPKTPEPPVPPQKIKAKTIYIQDDSYSLNNYSLDNRIKLYNSAKKYLDKIDEKTCITKVKKGRKSLMTLSNMLFMDTKIGTVSAYGAIYLSSVLNVPNLLVVSKITKRTQDNLTELIIMEQLTEKFVKTKKTKHFPLIYTTHICPDVDEVLSVVSVNELCNGDLKMLINNESINDMPDEIVVNIIYQILISLTTFQHFGYLHNDSHWGNFLYQNNKEIGYYEYEYKNQTFFIPSCPYNIMLYDFGLSKEIGDPNDKKCYGDFGKPLTAFQPRHNPTYHGWNESINPRPLNDKIKRIQTKILDYEYFKLSNQDDVFITLLKILDNEFDDMVYKTTLKGNDIILNNTPFIIA